MEFSLLESWWSWVGAAFIFHAIGLVVKPMAHAALRRRRTAFTQTFVDTLRAHPIIAGIFLGFVPGVPVAPIVGDHPTAKAFYFAFAGAACTFVYDAIRDRLLKRKERSSSPGGEP